MTVEKYATKDDIKYFVKLFNEDFDDSKVTNSLLKILNAKVDAWMIEHGVNPRGKSDRLNLLYAATITFALEWFCYMGDLSWSTGDVALQKLNRATYAFQRWQPMFFFATGASDPFKGLLPHESYRMMAYAYVEAYCRDDFFVNNGTVYPIPRISKDQTSRGWNWYVDDDIRKAADLTSEGEEENLESYYDTDFDDWGYDEY